MVAIVVTLLLYKKRVAAEKRAVLEHKAAEIRKSVASILSLGGGYVRRQMQMAGRSTDVTIGVML